MSGGNKMAALKFIMLFMFSMVFGFVTTWIMLITIDKYKHNNHKRKDL
jgi:hypothetical protein